MKGAGFRILILFFLIHTLHAKAGWVITQRHSNDDGLIKYESLTIEGNLIKSAGLDGTLIFDLQNRTFLLANEKKKVYWNGSIDEFRDSFRNSIQSIIDELIKELPADQQEIYSGWFGEMLNMYAKPDLSKIDKPKVEIKQSDDYEQIAGFKSNKFDVFVDDSLREKIWISSAIPIKKEFDMKRFTQFVNEIEPSVNGEYIYQNSDAYLNLMSQGFPMRTVDLSGIQIEVIKVEKVKTQKSDFEISGDYKKVGLDEIIRLSMIGNGTTEDEEDSDK